MLQDSVNDKGLHGLQPRKVIEWSGCRSQKDLHFGSGISPPHSPTKGKEKRLVKNIFKDCAGFSGGLQSGLVWIWNGQKDVGLQIVWISNGILKLVKSE